MEDATEVAAPMRKAGDVLTEIETKLATLDGIATSDAFRLGGLVREYGELKAGESANAIMKPLLTAMLKPKKDDLLGGNPDKPWL